MRNRNLNKFIAAGILAVLSISIVAGQTTDSVTNQGGGVTPYGFDRINEHNFHSRGWQEQEVLSPSGMPQVFLDESEHMSIVCGPDNDSDPRLIKGSITMNLPTTANPTLRRIRLRRGGYSGTFFADLTELKYSTYVVHGSPTVMVLQVDVNGDAAKDFNIFYAPGELGNPPFTLDTWQQSDALQGVWGVEASTIPGLSNGTEISVEELVALFPAARIIDTPPVGHNGEGVRFTIGGGPTPSQYFDNVSYFDGLILGTADQNHSTLFDFTCDSSD
jgi:hypothetical protein